MVWPLSCCVKTEETCGIRDGEFSDGLWRRPACRGDALDRAGDPRRLVALSAIRNWREIWRVGFHQQTVVGNESQQVVVDPLLECDDAAERNVPSRFEGRVGEGMRARKAVQDAADARSAGLAYHRCGIVLGLARVHDDRASSLARERELRGEGAALERARRVVVVVVEPALANGDGSPLHLRA